jgi:AAA family ATP:ADP antiporter
MAQWPHRLTRLDRFLSRFTWLRPGEGRSVVAFFTYALLMMVSYYILKTIREPLLLTGSGAEMKSYAYAVVALLLLFIVPLYGLVFRYTRKQQLTRYITVFFLLNLFVFYVLGRSGVDIGFAYYVWVGIFSVMITAQFWAFAADSYNVKSGKRLFPVIMVGATLGGLFAPSMSGALFSSIGPWKLMLIAMALLGATVFCVSWARSSVPPGSRSLGSRPNAPQHGGLLGGFSLVLSDRYLLFLALLIVLLNWVNTTGEYILAELVVRHADALAATVAGFDKADFIATFYGNFFFIVNLITLAMQVLLVARVIRWAGVRGAILVLPVVSLLGYGLVMFFPVFSLIRVVKILENSTDYSLMNTSRHALYLPLSAAKKYEGKTAIEAFFWRFGDLAQAGAIYAGLNWFSFEIHHFAMVNFVLSIAWLLIAWQVGRHYRARRGIVGDNAAPRLYRAPSDRHLAPGEKFRFELPEDTFLESNEGDVVRFSACLAGGAELPPWISFDPEKLTFSGTVPESPGRSTQITLRATDFDGDSVEGKLVLQHTDGT